MKYCKSLGTVIMTSIFCPSVLRGSISEGLDSQILKILEILIFDTFSILPVYAVRILLNIEVTGK